MEDDEREPDPPQYVASEKSVFEKGELPSYITLH